MKVKQENLNFFYGYRCNYSCEGCFSGSDVIRKTDKDPHLDDLKKSVKKASELFEVNSMITLIGGEPFLYWDTKIVPLAIEINHWFPGKRINITTNGQLIGKYVEKIIELSRKIDNLSFTISQHLDGIESHQVKTIWENSINTLIDSEMIVKIHDHHYHIKGNINCNIYFYKATEWKPYYYHNRSGQIKPWATNDPNGSMEHGCPGNVCSCIIGNKLYKCPTLATLSDHLSAVDQLDDPDWSKYLDYPAIDMNDIDQNLMNEFIESYGKPTTYCDMCNNNPTRNTNWKNRTYKMIFIDH